MSEAKTALNPKAAWPFPQDRKELEAERDALRRQFESTVATTIRLITERDALKALNAELVEALERVSAIYGMNSARMAPMIAGNDQMEPLMVHVSAILLKASK